MLLSVVSEVCVEKSFWRMIKNSLESYAMLESFRNSRKKLILGLRIDDSRPLVWIDQKHETKSDERAVCVSGLVSRPPPHS